jgi:hypothetical protein
MGFAKQRLEEQRQQGWKFTGGSVCEHCFTDPDLKAHLLDLAKIGDCDFCGRTDAEVADFDEVMEYIVRCIREEYSTPDEEGLPWDEEDGRYWPETFDTRDMFEHLGGFPTETEAVIERIVEARVLQRHKTRYTLPVF